jgi:glycosyltransferase involved in cell wall biosynthesis
MKHFPELAGRLYSDVIVDGVRVIRPRGIEYFRKSMPRRFIFESLFALSVFPIFLRIPRPHVIIGAYPPAVLPSVSLFISKMLRIPFIFEVRDLMADALLANNYSKSRLFNRAAIWVENFIYQHCAHIVTVSDGIKKCIVNKGISAAKITPIKNGYEPQVFSNADYSFNPRKEFSWDDKFVAIYAGALTESYDIPTLLRAAELTKKDKQIFYVIIGEGNRKKTYVDYCRSKSLSNVQILAARPRKMMPAILSSANVGVHLFRDNPLWSYVLGNKPFDYLGSGIPMIYSGTGDTAELVLNARAGYVVRPESPSEVIKKIKWLKKHPKVAAAMGARGTEYVQTNFNRFNLLEKFEDVLLKVLDEVNA